VNYARRGKRRDQDRDLADRQMAHAYKARARKFAGHDRYRSILGLRERQLPQVPATPPPSSSSMMIPRCSMDSAA
jgi:hypothetical protein